LRVQRQSEGIKKGEPRNHRQAIEFVVKWYYDNNPDSKLIPDLNWVEFYSHKFVVENKMYESGYTSFKHKCDLVFKQITHIKGSKIENANPLIFIEIDGERHDNVATRIADGLFDKWINETYNNLPVYRIPKYIFQNTTDDLTNEELSTIYLREFARRRGETE